MTKSGQAKVDAAKRSGRWEIDPRPLIAMAVPQEFSEALEGNRNAKDFSENLAPTYRKQFIGWIGTAKQIETKAKSITESLALLARGERLGLK